MTIIVELAVKCVEERVKEPKPIELVKYLQPTHEDIFEAKSSAVGYDYAALLEEEDDLGHLAVIICWDEGGRKQVYLGHWNDGCVD